MLQKLVSSFLWFDGSFLIACLVSCPAFVYTLICPISAVAVFWTSDTVLSFC